MADDTNEVAETEVKEAETVTVTTATQTPQTKQSSDVNQVLTVEQMISGYMGDIGRLQEQIKSQKEMFKQSFEQDKAYSEAEEEAKKLNQKKIEQKQRIVKSDAVSAVQMKIDELNTELKEARQSLSDYLNRYILLTQKSEFLGPDGEAYQIIRSAKLVKKK